MCSNASQQITILLLFVQCVLSTTVTRIQGSQRFSPCVYRSKEHDVVCDHRASQAFGTDLPIIELDDDLRVDRVRIRGHENITRCVPNTFVATKSNIRDLQILNTSLTDIQTGCFKGLENLELLEIENAELGENVTSSTLFHELQYLVNLKELHLVNLNLSDGIPSNIFSNWATKLKRIRLSNNHLSWIDDDAFKITNSELIEIQLHKQVKGWKLLNNSHRWARRLTALKLINLTETPLQPKNGIVTINFGNQVNHNLITLVLNKCSITNFHAFGETEAPNRGIKLAPELATQLRRLYIDHNRFSMTRPNKSSLDGLKDMDYLEVLSLRHNRIPLYSLPSWMGYSGMTRLRELYLEQDGIRYLGPWAFPSNIHVLYLSANPLRYVDTAWGSNLVGLRELHMNRIRLDGVNVGGKRGVWTKALESVVSTLDLLSLVGCQLQSEMFEPGGRLEPVLKLNMFIQLRTLILDSNKLTYIPKISELRYLRTLSLTRNQLQDLGTAGRLEQRREKSRLKWIDVRYNRLKTLDRCQVALGFHTFLDDLIPEEIAMKQESVRVTNLSLQAFGLTGNPLICDCRLAWLSRYVRTMKKSKQHINSTDGLVEGALDFTCTNVGRWKNRQFLSLKPEDLYAVDHRRCRQYPEVYGRPTRPNEPLPICQWANLTPHQRNRTRLVEVHEDEIDGMRRTTLFMVDAKKEEPSQLTKIAFILLIIAGIIAVCFILVSTTVIVWICLKNQRWKPWKTKESRTQRTSSQCCPRDQVKSRDSRKHRYVPGRKEVQKPTYGREPQKVVDTIAIESQTYPSDTREQNLEVQPAVATTTTQMEYQRILPWRSGKSPQRRIRFRLPKPQAHHRQKETPLGEKEEKVKRARSRFGPLKRTLKVPPTGQNQTQPDEETYWEDDNRSKMQGPALPRVQFVVTPNETIPNNLPQNIHYLPMTQEPEIERVAPGKLKPAKRLDDDYLKPKQQITAEERMPRTQQKLSKPVEAIPKTIPRSNANLSGNFYTLPTGEYIADKRTNYLNMPLPPPPPTPPPIAPEDIEELLKRHENQTPSRPIKYVRATPPRLPPLAVTRKVHDDPSMTQTKPIQSQRTDSDITVSH